MGKQRKKTAKLIRTTDRLRYPEDEAANPWLSVLLDAYHIQDTGISVELVEEQKRRRDKLACHSGCGTCCQSPTIPVTEVEVKGIVWFVANKLPHDVREAVHAKILNHRNMTRCPFMVDSVCTIYPVRPIACRKLLVFGAPCIPHEDIFYTRPQDIWRHSRDTGRKITLTLLPLYGITGKKNKIEAFETGYLNKTTTSMLELDWEKLCGLDPTAKDT
jgi:hypothetical protein